jgi:hypothetical protein
MLKEMVNNTIGLMSDNSGLVIGLIVIALFIAYLIDRSKLGKSKDSDSGTGGGGGNDTPPTQEK